MNLLLSQLTPTPATTESGAIAPALPGAETPALTLPGTPSGESTPVAFNDALLNIINTLMGGEQTRDTTMVLAGLDTDEDEDTTTHTTDSNLPTPDATTPPQALLDTLLMASLMPVKTLNATSATPQTGEALKMQTLSAGHSPLSNALSLTPQTPAPVSVTPEPAADLGKPLAAEVVKTLAEVLPGAGQPAAAGQTFSTVMDKQTVHLPPVKLDADETKWAQQLHSALNDRLQIQVKNQVQHATIRLDPPEMGKVDISLQIENGRMQVHISASNSETVRALQQISNELRQSLTEQNFVQVNVQVSAQSGQQQGRGQQLPAQADRPDAGAEIAAEDAQSPDGKDDSVLLTV
ncbi:flagellar hook-length control protein FliK [Lelliottia wanjuensis]|uniref:flagellar hook-length control protein FliK n=1 Tax=Lelliottia wanjuensis TaxID=3050585 RepID=UPI00254BAA56|nr:flagellar hook-length control protein FliK [Lelliottia sp. V104_15]MDK9607025.1 flagellar hook-length control protein FliK [Lelliottia sp. V104_15]